MRENNIDFKPMTWVEPSCWALGSGCLCAMVASGCYCIQGHPGHWMDALYWAIPGVLMGALVLYLVNQKMDFTEFDDDDQTKDADDTRLSQHTT